jgi:hypothetical protein
MPKLLGQISLVFQVRTWISYVCVREFYVVFTISSTIFFYCSIFLTRIKGRRSTSCSSLKSNRVSYLCLLFCILDNTVLKILCLRMILSTSTTLE